MDFTRDIQTLSEFKQNASKLIKQLQETRQPVVLTVNGKPAAVVQDPES
ncbi:MAG: type II toxin-antitoxin system Phd/YefM family antitoxin, partial [Pyrinomonadaceae bacterium]